MHAHRELISVAVLGAVLVQGACTGSSRTPVHREAPERQRILPTDPRLAVSPRTEVNPENASRLAADISQRAAQMLLADRVERDLVETLRPFMQQVLTAILTKDFDAYDTAMTSRGAQLGTAAPAIVAQELDSGRYPINSTTAAAWPLRAKLKYLWEHPEFRRAHFARIADDRLSAGTGMDLDRSWNPLGYRGQDSLWDPPDGRFSLYTPAMDDEIPSAWIEMPVEFQSGDRFLMRLVFVYRSANKEWYPMTFMLSATSYEAPVPLF